MKLTLQLLIALYFFSLATQASANQTSTLEGKKLSVEITLTPFTFFTEKPYLALWYSQKNQTDTPLLVLRADSKWLRDLKSFWRNVARYQRGKLDGITSATVKSGAHVFTFDLPKDALSQIISYKLEVVRENGDRELLSINMVPDAEHHSKQKVCSQGKLEIASFCLSYL
ncbi:DUF2271 domain-containing protein [Shewanella benthica]|nr:DUF2271 domain-containing protein [Shewanella benthica]